MNYDFNFGSTTMPQIIHEKHNTLSVAGYIQWPKGTERSKKAAFAYNIQDGNDKVIHHDAFSCDGIESINQLELYAIHIALLPIPPEIFIVIKATQAAVINGINTDMDYWAANDWITKNGTPVKNRELWEYIYEEKQQRRMMMALQLAEQEKNKLQAISKTLVSVYSRR
jgi:ribonuclease HI